jgi:hypothetical protein
MNSVMALRIVEQQSHGHVDWPDDEAEYAVYYRLVAYGPWKTKFFDTKLELDHFLKITPNYGRILYHWNSALGTQQLSSVNFT